MTDTPQSAWMREYERLRAAAVYAASNHGKTLASIHATEGDRDTSRAALTAAHTALDAHVRGLVDALSGLLSEPPTFRDYTGTDEDTCGYCHTALEGYEGRVRGEHSPTCPWAIARAALAAPKDTP